MLEIHPSVALITLEHPVTTWGSWLWYLLTLQREPFHPWDVTRCSRELYWLGELVLSLAGMTLVSLGQGKGQGGGPMRHQLGLLSRALPLREESSGGLAR